MAWIINTKTYIIDGIEIPKGRMRKIVKGERPIINNDWRTATDKEVETKKYSKGHYFNLKNV